jgi:uroporphyrinogen decarboxylase
VDATPIWLMRQAGRYMPEYRALRERYGILDIIKDPALACEVTLQPLRAFDLDAAIIFSDILPPLEAMGLRLSYERGEGPVIHNPVRTIADVERLATPPAEEALPFTLNAIRLVRKELEPSGIPVIGFSGAPFTLATYAIEGGPSRHHARTKQMMMDEPAVWDMLMSKLAVVSGEFLLAQAKAGAQALQLFDSWVGELSPYDYRKHVLPYTRRALAIARHAEVPIIHFGVNTSGLLECLREAGGDVLGVDWRISLAAARQRLGATVPLQGNLDPVALLGSWEALRERAFTILEETRGWQGHIFNVGHGVLPQTPVDNVHRLVDFVHEVTARQPRDEEQTIPA